MKRCTRCGTEKPLEAFYIDRSHTDGRRSFCKDCQAESSRDACPTCGNMKGRKSRECLVCTLARRNQAIFDASVVHIDTIFVPRQRAALFAFCEQQAPLLISRLANTTDEVVHDALVTELYFLRRDGLWRAA